MFSVRRSTFDVPLASLTSPYQSSHLLPASTASHPSHYAKRSTLTTPTGSRHSAQRLPESARATLGQPTFPSIHFARSAASAASISGQIDNSRRRLLQCSAFGVQRSMFPLLASLRLINLHPARLHQPLHNVQTPETKNKKIVFFFFFFLFLFFL